MSQEPDQAEPGEAEKRERVAFDCPSELYQSALILAAHHGLVNAGPHV